MNSPLCPNCYTSNSYPINPSSLTYPASLEASMLSSSVLASVGAGLCKSQHLPPVIGIAIGTLAGMGLSVLKEKSITQQACLKRENNNPSYYCQNCQSVFTPKPMVLNSMAEFS